MANNEWIGNAGLRAEAGLSAATHLAPGILERPTRFFAGLRDGDDRDELLRWTLSKNAGHDMPDAYWVRVAGNPNARLNPKTWGRVLVAARRTTFEDVVGSGGRPAVAYRPGPGGLTMVGTKQLHVAEPGDENFLRAIDVDGTPNPDGQFMGVVMREGPTASEMAIGTATEKGDYFWAIGTFVVGRLAETPEGLLRV